MTSGFGDQDDVCVVLDTKRVRPGDQVRGRVVLRGDARRCQEVEVTLSGEERISWKEWLGVEKPKFRTHAVFQPLTAVAKNTAAIDLPATTPLPASTSVDVPFSVQLPSGVPGSFWHPMPNVEFGVDVQVTITYQVSARVLGGRTSAASSKTFEVEWASSVPVAAPAQDVASFADAKLDKLSTSERLRSFGLVPRGEITISGSLPNATVSTTSDVAMQLRVDNCQSKMDVKRIRLGLYALATVCLHRCVDDKKLHHAPQFVCHREFEGVARGEYVDRVLSMPTTPNEVTSSGQPLAPTASTHFLTLSYLLAAECKMRHGSTHRVHAPIVLTRSTSEAAGALDHDEDEDRDDPPDGVADNVDKLISLVFPDN
ncbi:hypothetical protein PINS_up013911 [Pythium insidiosum]|nr:hypothetical protein PINS_up013911 [Pythium insidiosum]